MQKKLKTVLSVIDGRTFINRSKTNNDMAKVVMAFSRLSVTEQIERGRQIITAMTGNASYPTPNPTLVAFGAAIDALELAYNEAINGDRVKKALMRLRRKEFLALVVQLAGYVQEASAGDPEVILSSGFSIRKAPVAHGDTVGQVHDLRLEDGSVSGKVKASWSAAFDAVIYLIEASPTADFVTSELKGITTKTTKEIDGFAVGNTMWVRIVPLGKENAGTKSDPVSIVIR